MKTIKQDMTAFAQGDVFFIRRDKLPSTAEEVQNKVIAHSETGHHHVVEGFKTYRDTKDPNKGYLVPIPRAKAVIQHLRPENPHETLKVLDGIGDGVIEYHRQQEYTPQGNRRVED